MNTGASHEMLLKLEELLGIKSSLHEVSLALPRLSQKLSLEELGNLLIADPHHSLWRELVKELTVPETYFYRIPEHWKLFRSLLANGNNPMKVWCAACSTGEEPYTAAIEAARSKVGVDIVATDLVPERLESARKGLFSHNSFRGVEPHLKSHYFESEGQFHRIRPSVARNVRFLSLNLADRVAMRRFIESEGPFDVIFCRNVLIYFREDVCRGVTADLSSALKSGGTLFAGAADFPSRWNSNIESVEVEGALVWRNKAQSPTQTVRRTKIEVPVRRAGVSPTKAIPVTKKETNIHELFQKHTDTAAQLEAARRYLDRNILHPVAHLALGNVLEHLQQTDAAYAAYKQAVFLEPSCSFAHLRLAHLHFAGRRMRAATHHLAAAQRYEKECQTTREVLHLMKLGSEDFLRSIQEMGERVRKLH